MYLAKLYEEAHFAAGPDDAHTLCGREIHDEFLVKDLGMRNAVYYIAKFDDSPEMTVCTECSEAVHDAHDLSDEEYDHVVDLAQR